MNKMSQCLAGLILVSVSVQAQIFPDYGIISGEERQLKECAFDKEAEAVYLLHQGVSTYND
ncbi:MAG TPA: hypothetical protein VFD56_06430, partial [Chitinophagaceae bacterium]|nr:hypothetical protein [Chitinophagaceae bacterium]